MNKQQQIEQELSLKPFAFQQKVEACKALYISCQGRHHDYIQQQMRLLGNDRWNNRCLYARWRGNKRQPGWPERFGWDEEIGRARRASPQGTRILARGKATGRNPGTPADPISDPAGVASERPAPLQGANPHTFPGVSPKRLHPGLISASPAATGTDSQDSPDSPDFLAWLKRLPGSYTWTWKFQKYIIKKLEAFERGDTKRLMLFVPPRHGKSELVTVRYAAWHLQNNPKTNIIIGSYNQKLANRFSRKIRNVYAEALQSEPPAVAGGLTQEITTAQPTHDRSTCDICIAKAQECPHQRRNAGTLARTVATAMDTEAGMGARVPTRRIQTDAEWETSEGGGVRSVGCGAGITGFGANLIIIDDPVKSRSEAESQTIRDKVFDWFNDDIYTRLEPDGKIILIQTRWHEDDLAGRLLREMREDEDAEKWEVIEFPAIAEERRGEEEKMRRGDDVKSSLAESDNFSSSRLHPFSPSPAPQLFYIRNGQHIPIYTLGDPNKRRSGEPRAATPPGERTVAELPQHWHALVPERSAFPIGSKNDLGGYASAPGGGIAAESVLPADGKAEPFRSPGGTAARVSNSRLQTQDSGLTLKRDPLGRFPGEALCPERYDVERLTKIKRRLGTYSFSALYQQRPIPAEGGFFKRHWFKIIDHVPPGLKWKRGYDLGISASPGADYTATARVAFDADGNMYIDRVLRRRMEYPEQRRAILALIADERDTEHFIEKSANGNAVIQDLRRERGITDRHFRGVEVRESKTARAFTWNALAEEGRVHLIRSAWNTEFIDEACSFPGGVNDDQIDAVSIAVKMLREEKKREAHGF